MPAPRSTQDFSPSRSRSRSPPVPASSSMPHAAFLGQEPGEHIEEVQPTPRGPPPPPPRRAEQRSQSQQSRARDASISSSNTVGGGLTPRMQHGPPAQYKRDSSQPRRASGNSAPTEGGYTWEQEKAARREPPPTAAVAMRTVAPPRPPQEARPAAPGPTSAEQPSMASASYSEPRNAAPIGASESLASASYSEPADNEMALLAKLQAAKVAAEAEAAHYRSVAAEESLARQKAERKASMIEEEIQKLTQVQANAIQAEEALQKAERRERKERATSQKREASQSRASLEETPIQQSLPRANQDTTPAKVARDEEESGAQEPAAAPLGTAANPSTATASNKKKSSWPAHRTPTLEDALHDPLILEQQEWADYRETKIQIATEQNEVDEKEALDAKLQEEEKYRLAVEQEAEARRRIYERRTGERHPVTTNIEAHLQAKAAEELELTQAKAHADHMAQFDHRVNGPLGALCPPPPAPQGLELPPSPLRDISIAAARPLDLPPAPPLAPQLAAGMYTAPR